MTEAEWTDNIQSDVGTQIYYTSYEPSQKPDAHGLYEGVCSCGEYRSAPTLAAQAEKFARLHHEAKHSHG